MKRIKNIKDLEFEKIKLRVKQLELERQMERSWKTLTKKLSFAESVQRNESTSGDLHFKTSNKFLDLALNYGSDFLSHRLGMLAGKKIEGLAERAFEKLSAKLNASFSKRKRSF